jgi:hypothetical protein
LKPVYQYEIQAEISYLSDLYRSAQIAPNDLHLAKDIAHSQQWIYSLSVEL